MCRRYLSAKSLKRGSRNIGQFEIGLLLANSEKWFLSYFIIIIFACYRWIKQKTDGRIKEIVDSSIDPTTKAIIAGALYFNGNWEYPFFAEATKW